MSEENMEVTPASETTEGIVETNLQPNLTAEAPLKVESADSKTPSKFDVLKQKAQASQSETTAGSEGKAPVTPKTGEQKAGEVPAAFSPNFKFKVMDEEKEVPEQFRALIKDAKTEKEVKAIFEKAYGLDFHKPKYEQLKVDHEKVVTEHTNLNKSLSQLSKFVEKKDYNSFFEALKISKVDILEYTKSLLAEIEMPEEQRRQIEAQRQERNRLYQLEEQNQELSTKFETEQVQARTFQLNSALARPEYSQVASQFDARAGRPNAFAFEVMKLGAEYERRGQLLGIEQAVQETVKFWSPFLGAPQGNPQNTQINADTQQGESGESQQTVAKPLPVLPNVSGRATSPIKQGVKSIADLKKLSKAMQ